MFLVWKSSVYRPTHDIDFLGNTTNDLGTVTRIFQSVCEQEVAPDGLTFDSQTVRSVLLKGNTNYQGVRVKLLGYLGKAQVSIQIDLGFGDIVSPAPIMLEYPTILQMPAPNIRGYTPDSVVAEKLQALVYLGKINSRMKDFYDLWVLAKQFEFDGQRLQDAISATFRTRSTGLPKETPTGLGDSFAIENQAQWQAFIQRTNLESVPGSFSDISQVLNSFLIPPMHATAHGYKFKGKWEPGGPWKY